MDETTKPVVCGAKPPCPTEPLLQLHIAEYEAITSRATNLILVAYSQYSVLVILLALAAQVWPTIDRALLLWGGAIAAQGLGFVAAQAQLELMRHIFYLERELRPKLEAIVGSSDFWLFERSIGRDRPTHPVWWEWAYAPVIAVGLLWISYVRFPFHAEDYVCLILNLASSVVLIRTNLAVFKLRLAVRGDGTVGKPVESPEQKINSGQSPA